VPEIYSHSRLENFENCPRRFQYRYRLGLPPESESIEAFVGKRVHEILERLYQFVDRGLLPSLERVIDRYHRTWEEQFDPERVRIVRQGTDASFYRDNGVRCLTNYYRRHYPFDTDETLGLEKPVQFALDSEGQYRVRGIIDRLVRAPDGAVEIHDFKTGRRVPPQQELDRDRQLALYEMAVRAELGETGAVRLVWHFVLLNQVRTSMRTPEQLASLRGEIGDMIDRIRAETEWVPRPSPLCDWCEYKGMCPAFANERSGPSAPDPEGGPDDAATEAALESQLQLF